MATLIQENGNTPSVKAARSAPFRPWRIALRALGFASFGLISFGLGTVVIPLQRLAARARRIGGSDELRAQRAIHRGMALWVRLASAWGVIRVSVHGGEALRNAGPVVVVANHPSLIDTPILLGVMPQADLIVNAAWGDNSFLRGCVSGAG